MAAPRQALIRRLSALAIAVVAIFIGHTPAQAQTHRAALVIQHGAGWTGPRILFRCVEFAQEAISGLALLELSGVNSGQPPQVYDWGAGAETVCQIDHEPRAVPDRCFGPTSGPNWSDWSLASAGWVPRPTGAGTYSIHDGDVEGWSYSIGYGTPPPSIRFSQVCPTAAAPTRSAPAAAALTTNRATPVATHPVVASTATQVTPLSSASALALATGTSSSAPLAPAEKASDPSPRSSPPSPLWLLLAVSGAGLIGLTFLNLRRRSR